MTHAMGEAPPRKTARNRERRSAALASTRQSPIAASAPPEAAAVEAVSRRVIGEETLS
jgi:hypothetical protein